MAEIPEKWGKITKFPSRPDGEKLPKSCIYPGNFSHFRGMERGGESRKFSPLFGRFSPRRVPGCKDKNNLQHYQLETAGNVIRHVSLFCAKELTEFVLQTQRVLSSKTVLSKQDTACFLIRDRENKTFQPALSGHTPHFWYTSLFKVACAPRKAEKHLQFFPKFGETFLSELIW